MWCFSVKGNKRLNKKKVGEEKDREEKKRIEKKNRKLSTATTNIFFYKYFIKYRKVFILKKTYSKKVLIFHH